MPKKQAAFKHLRQTKRRTAQNQAVKAHLRVLAKKIRISEEAKKTDEARTVLVQMQKALDKAAQQGVIKKNTSARKKSRLMKRLARSASK